MEGTSIRATELNAEFGVSGVLDFAETEHGLVKAVVSLDGVTFAVHGTRRVSWRTGRVDIDLLSDSHHFIGGLHNLLWKGEPYRFRIETPSGAPVGDAILRPRRAVEAEVRETESAAP